MTVRAIAVEVGAHTLEDGRGAKGVYQALALGLGLGRLVEETELRQVVELILLAVAVVVVAIELPCPATQGVGLTELAVTGPAIVAARDGVAVGHRLARRIN